MSASVLDRLRVCAVVTGGDVQRPDGAVTWLRQDIDARGFVLLDPVRTTVVDPVVIDGDYIDEGALRCEGYVVPKAWLS